MGYAAIFDLDGVLVDSNAAHFMAFRRIGQDLGCEFAPERLQRTFGMHNNQIFPMLLERALTQGEVDALAEQKEAYYREFAKDTLQPIPGALELLRSVRAAGWRVAIGSSGPGRNVRMAIEVLGIGGELDAVVTGDDVVYGKPAPDIFCLCLQKLARLPHECVVLEDAPQGIAAALAAGIPVVALTSSQPRELLGRAHKVVDKLAELTPGTLAELIDLQLSAGQPTVG